MDELRKDEETEHSENQVPGGPSRGLIVLIVLLAAAAIVGAGYALHQNQAVTDLTTQNHSLRSSLDQMQKQMNIVTARLDRQTAAPPPAPATPPKAAVRERSAARRVSRRLPSPQDRRIRQLQLQLAFQRKQLQQMQQEVVGTRSDLEGKLGSTRDELNGSIARNHAELVALEKRGERNYYEFDLWKSKSFEREGPIEISLRKADTKHQTYNLVMLVNDHELSKKKVVLYEPVWLSEADQPLQVVVNKIGKNYVHGYVSAPKYTESQLSSSIEEPAPSPAQASGSRISSDPSSSSSSSTPTSTPATSSSASRR